jgi:hypothetical protein
MKAIFFLILFIALFSSCRKNDEICCDNIPTTRDTVLMNLSELKSGQKFRYILLTANGYYERDSIRYTYTGDTLELEILTAENQKYLISEKITPGSTMMTGNDRYYWNNKDSIYYNYWFIRNDSLVIVPRYKHFNSHLIFNYDGKFSLRESTGKEVLINGWKTTYPYIESDISLFTKNFTLLGNFYNRLNIYINNSSMAADGPGNTTIYSKEYGIVRTSKYSWWTGRGIGWDKL